jgi:hypothetical protein
LPAFGANIVDAATERRDAEIGAAERVQRERGGHGALRFDDRRLDPALE